jgi:CRISPR-associated endonuclease Csn1
MKETGHRRVRIHKTKKPDAPLELIEHGPDANGKTHVRAVIPGDNYCMDIVETPDGKWHSLGITRFEAHKDGWEEKWRGAHPDGRLVMRVRNGDVIKLEHDGQEQAMLVVRLNVSGNRFYLAPHNETGELAKRHADPEDEFRWDLATVSKLKGRRARLVHVSPDGRLIDPGPTS